MSKLYRQSTLTNEQEDRFVFPHKMAMTGEKLHSKSEIAYELGVRDKRIVELEINQIRAERLIFELHEQVHDSSYLDGQVELYEALKESK
jgi:hypothetical protein